MSWVKVGKIKGDTGATGATGDTGSQGSGVNVYKDSAHGQLIFVGDETQATIYLSELKGATGDTGPAGPVNLVSTLDTSDSTNAVTNNAIATAIQNVTNQIGTITSAQTANLTLLGS